MEFLPEEIVRPAQKKELFFTLAGVLCIVLTVNFVCAWHLKIFSRELGRQLIVSKWEKLKGLEKPADWLILGDSSGNQSLMPQVLHETLKIDSVNLCTVGGLILMNDLWMLRWYIEKFGSPQGVILVHTVDMWSRELNKDAMALIPLPWGFWKIGQLKVDLTFKEKGKVFLQKYFPLYSSYKSFTQKILSPRSTLEPQINLREDGFMMETIPDVEMVEADKVSVLDRIQKSATPISLMNLQALDSLQQLAEENHFEIYVVHGPLLAEVYEQKIFRLYFDKIESELRYLFQKKNRLHLVLEDPLTYPLNLMQSVDHIIEPGARLYSQVVSRKLKQKKDEIESIN